MRIFRLPVILPVIMTLVLFLSGERAPGFAASNPFTGLSAQEINALLAGKITISEEQVSGAANDHQKNIVARLIVDRPIENVWQVVSNQPLMFSGDPRVKSVQVVDRLSPFEEHVAYHITIGRMLPDFIYTTQVRYNKPHEASFTRISGSFRDFKSQCRLYSIEQGRKTFITYSMYIDFGFFIPKFVVRAILKQDIPGIAESVRQVVYEKFGK